MFLVPFFKNMAVLRRYCHVLFTHATLWTVKKSLSHPTATCTLEYELYSVKQTHIEYYSARLDCFQSGFFVSIVPRCRSPPSFRFAPPQPKKSKRRKLKWLKSICETITRPLHLTVPSRCRTMCLLLSRTAKSHRPTVAGDLPRWAAGSVTLILPRRAI